jgi:hypothetical protein
VATAIIAQRCRNLSVIRGIRNGVNAPQENMEKTKRDNNKLTAAIRS